MCRRTEEEVGPTVPCERSCHKEYTCNMKALSLLVRKLWPRLKLFKSRSNFKVKVTRSKIRVPCERPCHKEYESPTGISFSKQVMAKVKVLFTHPTRTRTPGL